MIFIYNYTINKFISILIIPLILDILLIVLNKLLSKLIKIKSISSVRSDTKGLEIYEFGTHSIGVITTISNNQFIILCILFLIFDIELIFLIPFIIEIKLLLSIQILIILIFSHLIIYSLLIELYESIIIWYKPSQI